MQELLYLEIRMPSHGPGLDYVFSGGEIWFAEHRTKGSRQWILPNVGHENGLFSSSACEHTLRTTLKSAVCMFTNSPPLFFYCGNSSIDFTGIVSVRSKTLAEWPVWDRRCYVPGTGSWCIQWLVMYPIQYWCIQWLSTQPSLKILAERTCNTTDLVK